MSERADSVKTGSPRALLGLALTLAVVLGAMGTGIVLTHRESRRQILENFDEKGATSAGFVSTFFSQQAAREAQVAQEQLGGQRGLPTHFRQIVASFGSQAAVLLDSSGRLLQVAPADPAILGARIAPHYAHLSAAEEGRPAVSGVVLSAAKHRPVVAIAVPYPTPHGKRVFSVAYPVAGSILEAFIAHAVAYKRHLVLLVDASGKIVTASPSSSATTFTQAAPALETAVGRRARGVTSVSGVTSSYVDAAVAGTPWHLIIAIPNRELLASVSGWALWLPWIVFATISSLSIAVLMLYGRSLVAHRRLQQLSAELGAAAHTDALTGLANRRSLQDRIPQAWAYAHRRNEPLSALIIDLDHFKGINDTFGHDVGDELLRAVAECMHAVFRASDIFGRWGGDEFLAFLPGTDIGGAEAAGQRLREKVEAVQLARLQRPDQVKLSFGCASGTELLPHDLIAHADKELYRVKHNRDEPSEYAPAGEQEL